MSEVDKFKLGATPSRVSFSRGLLKHMLEEPIVGRKPGDMAAPPYTSTPKPQSLTRDEWWSEKLEKIERQHKGDVEWQSMRIQHLERLLEGERRMVDTLSKFADMPKDYQQARIDTHKTSLETLPMDLDSILMPELVTVEGVREELGRVKSDMSRSAADVFNSRAVPLKMLVPQALGEKTKVCKPTGLVGVDKNK